MKLYRLDTPVQAGGDRITLTDAKHRIFSFFIRGEGDDKWLQFAKPKAQAQPGIKLQDLQSADFLRATIGVPIFSEKARAALSAAIPDELKFYECTVQCQGTELPFFLAKTLLRLPLVDKEKSEFKTLTTGDKVLTRTVYRTDLEQEFSIARDADFLERLVVTDRFVDLSKQNSLNINFAEPL